MSTNLQEEPESTIGHKPDEFRHGEPAQPPPAHPLPHGGAALRAEEGDESELGGELRNHEQEPEEPDLAVDPNEAPSSENEPEKPPHPWI